MSPEEMAASLTDSVYSTDSLDDLPATSQIMTPVSSAPLEALTRHCTDSLVQLSVMLSEKCEDLFLLCVKIAVIVLLFVFELW